jgi:hypothetical protein
VGLIDPDVVDWIASEDASEVDDGTSLANGTADPIDETMIVVITVLVDVVESVSGAATTEVVMLGFDIAIAVLEGATNVREVADPDVATSTVLSAAVVAGKTVDSRIVEDTGRNPAQGATGKVVSPLS